MKALALAGLLALSGCCTYHGKAISRRTAEHMQALGMDVVCPGEARVVAGQYKEPFFQPANCKDRRRLWRFWR